MSRTCTLALAVTLAAPATTAAQAPPDPPAPTFPAALPPPGSEAELHEMEQLTRLDLSKQWRGYLANRKRENFYQYVEKRLRRDRDIGRYMTMAGIGGLVGGSALLSVAALRTDDLSPFTATSYAIIGVSGVVTLVGAVVWGVYYKRLDRVDLAQGRYYVLGPRGRVRLRAGASGLQLAF